MTAEKKRRTEVERLAKMEQDAIYAERKADEWSAKAAKIRMRIEEKKQAAREIAGIA